MVKDGVLKSAFREYGNQRKQFARELGKIVASSRRPRKRQAALASSTTSVADVKTGAWGDEEQAVLEPDLDREVKQLVEFHIPFVP